MSLKPMLASALKYGVPAFFTAGASIAVAYIKSEADLSKSKIGIENLAASYNDLLNQAKRDHDELEELRGAVSVLTQARSTAFADVESNRQPEVERSHSRVVNAAPAPRHSSGPAPTSVLAPVANAAAPAPAERPALAAEPTGGGSAPTPSTAMPAAPTTVAMAPASAADEANAKRMRVAQAAKLEDRPAFMAKSLPSNFEALIKARAPVAQ
jgi:hypothetical protein